ncbi:NAD(+)/NADH kinase [Halobaculum sp. MBLA0143]|uniref:NAD(+)/NADH kinase n=1 Tax=Halobaculum sp. MBLA0143 TaxID=3079933 RepID=UPI0035255434
MYVGIVAQRGNDRAASLASSLRERLRAETVRVSVDPATAETLGLSGEPVSAFEAADLVVSVGGDGTFLYAAHGAGGTPVLGVNLGEVGFLNAVAPADAEAAVLAEVSAFRDDGITVREAPRIVASTDSWESRPAVNEIVVGGRRGHGGGVDVTVRVDDSVYTAGHADGVLVATPTGSTAYNLSERGPLVHPGVDALVVNEMAPTDGMPPLAVGADATVTVEVSATDETPVVVSDGGDEHRLNPPTAVTVAVADPPVRIAGPPTDFFRALDKLT